MVSPSPAHYRNDRECVKLWRSFLFAVENNPGDLKRPNNCPAQKREQRDDFQKRHVSSPLSLVAAGGRQKGRLPGAGPKRGLTTCICQAAPCRAKGGSYRIPHFSLTCNPAGPRHAAERVCPGACFLCTFVSFQAAQPGRGSGRRGAVLSLRTAFRACRTGLYFRFSHAALALEEKFSC